ncbi:glutathione transferase [Caenorhabditis elegans]|uniref:glutathione transferase n=1 Tax=Caenorhabditis elegans TaxID=6239 RepID=Q86S58_CAEEL|nr:Glutathione S-Transferase [Caenorhabditis elegans]CCD73729.1 Glutathione S-Transferase [Caenorhabditis elegans]|eukprot:NP_741060.2 Glutathione S-Transferase [Caenorhabditis elegans]
MPSYKLTYFDIRAFAEPARLLFHLGGVPYEDVRMPTDDIVPGIQSDAFLALKDKTPFGRFPVLSIDGFDLAQSTAIHRYLARKFGYAGKSPEDEAFADSIVDQVKEYLESFRPLLYAQKSGKPEEEVKRIHDEVYIPVKNLLFKILTRILKESKSEYLVGDGLTWADLVVADHLYSLTNIKELDPEDPIHLNLKKYQERIFNLPELKDYIETRPKRDL